MRPQRDRTSLQSRGVAAPVQPLVVVQHDRGELRVVQRSHQLRPLARVLLDDRELGVGQACGLLEDLRRRVELADIVEHGRRLDQRDLRAGQPHPPRRPRGVSRDAARMPVQVGIALVQRDR